MQLRVQKQHYLREEEAPSLQSGTAASPYQCAPLCLPRDPDARIRGERRRRRRRRAAQLVRTVRPPHSQGKVSLQILGESGEFLQKKNGVSPAHLRMAGHVPRADVRINLKGPSSDGFCCVVITC
ncbi:hypothetical protein OJAV_G00136580 [Oryzias javanicus]|uniref:Uncharacterized protein n=1 Tax=Oryzias javanicus TaxID=123683 RepID=A0A437CL20_ORYJA|nr:hypothetical protein OJAV_G00136580 [Oryzias javanicus]